MTLESVNCIKYIYQYLDQMDFACAMFSTDGHLFWWNKAAQYTSGWDAHDFDCSGILSIFRDLNNSELFHPVVFSPEIGHTDLGRCLMHCKCGEYKEVELFTIPMGQESDEPATVAIMFLEV